MASPSLPVLKDYSASDLELASSRSPVLKRYLSWVDQTPSPPSAQLRVTRTRGWLTAALATLLGRANAASVCKYWSDVADQVATRAWQLSGCAEHDLTLFALGKWGSEELNLSSDVDVIFVSRDNPDKAIFKCVRDFIALLSETTEFGFCFRVDTDLKPGGRMSPLVCSLQQFEDYYWSSGQTWERLALVRLRPIAGDKKTIASLLVVAEKFVFRRFIDFTLLEDLKHLRSQIHAHYPQGTDQARNLKLAPGGIRDIELFIHALQVIHGGKTPSLRTTSTQFAAQQLAAAKRFESAELEFLIESYWHFRQLENEVQAEEDHQTHDWTTRHGVDELKKFIQMAKKVESIVESVLGKAASKPSLPMDSAQREVWLRDLGYDEMTIHDRIPELMALTALSTKTAQDEELRLRVLRRFLEVISAVALDKNLGVALLIDFFRSTRAKTGFFSLLAIEDRLIHELSVLFGCSPYLGGVIAARPEVLDSFLFRTQARPSENLEHMLDELADRRLLNEIISGNRFLQTKDLGGLCASLSTSADEITSQLLVAVKNSVSARQLRVLALGKWGGNELGLRSDLDFIFITAETPDEEDQKAARRFISRLTEAHKGGAIYPIDMRLRPSGKGGLLLVSEAALLEYLRTQAEPWERQSYLRARDIQPHGDFQARVHRACRERGLTDDEVEKLAQIRAKLLVTGAESIEIKFSAGGLVDIEFAAQIALLKNQAAVPSATQTKSMITRLAESDTLWRNHQNILLKNYDFLRLVEQLFQILNLHPVTSFRVSDAGFQRVAKILGVSPLDLSTQIASILDQNVEVLKHLDLRNRSQ